MSLSARKINHDTCRKELPGASEEVLGTTTVMSAEASSEDTENTKKTSMI